MKENQNKELIVIEKDRNTVLEVYQDGEHVFHPYHGIGILTRTDVEKKILGKIKKFFVVKFSRKQLRMMVADIKNSMMCMIRSRKELKSVMTQVKDYEVNTAAYPKHPVKRYNLFTNLIKTGNLHKVAECLKAMRTLQGNIRLSKKEKKLLTSLENSISDVIAYMKDVSFDEAHKDLGAFI